MSSNKIFPIRHCPVLGCSYRTKYAKNWHKHVSNHEVEPGRPLFDDLDIRILYEFDNKKAGLKL